MCGHHKLDALRHPTRQISRVPNQNKKISRVPHILTDTPSLTDISVGHSPSPATPCDISNQTDKLRPAPAQAESIKKESLTMGLRPCYKYGSHMSVRGKKSLFAGVGLGRGASLTTRLDGVILSKRPPPSLSLLFASFLPSSSSSPLSSPHPAPREPIPPRARAQQRRSWASSVVLLLAQPVR